MRQDAKEDVLEQAGGVEEEDPRSSRLRGHSIPVLAAEGGVHRTISVGTCDSNTSAVIGSWNGDCLGQRGNKWAEGEREHAVPNCSITGKS